MIKRYFLIAFVVLLTLTYSLPSQASASVENGEAITRISGVDGGYDPVISSDGRYVAFISNAPDQSVFVHDRETGTTELIVVGPSDVVISGDGRYVAFATSGLAGDTTIFTDIFVHEIQTGITELASIASNGTQANYNSGMEELGTISADGRFVVFFSEASNLVLGDNNGIIDIFVRDRQTETTIRVSTEANGSYGPAVISGNGRFVAYRSSTSPDDIFVYDLQTGVTEQIDEAVQEQMIFSYDGRYIAFVSFMDHPEIGDVNGRGDVFLHDRLIHTTERVSIGAESDGLFLGGISADGRYVAFTPNELNIVIRDRVAGETILVEGNSGELAISDDGRYIAFEALSGIEFGDLNGLPDIYIRDLTITKNTEVLVGNLDVGEGGSRTSDSENDGATILDNVETTIISPNSGPFSIEESPNTSTPPSGFEFLDLQVIISAPAGTFASPLILGFRLDASVIPVDEDPTNISVLKNRIRIPICNEASGIASPDPCLLETLILEDGDLKITVLTSSASTWNFGFGPRFAFNGFFQPVDNPPVINVIKSGQAVPIKFSLGGNQGLDIFDTGYPKSQMVDCSSSAPLDVVEETVTAGSSSLSYSANIDQYTYVWKTGNSWAGTCRKFILLLSDGSEHVTIFKFKK